MGEGMPQVMKQSLLAATLALLAAEPACAMDDRWGLGYCPPPYPPACVARTGQTLQKNVACGREVEAYVASVFRYRECVSIETERAVREANRIIQALKCAQGEEPCPAKPAAPPVAAPR